MTTPAEWYAEFRQRQAEERTALYSFRELYSFGLDPFQVDACQALEEGSSVLVAAPTGSGKTIVGEFAVHLALTQGRKCFYTTPIKALSNQKYTDLVRRYGSDQVGLLTGDNTVNGEAPLVVMTTEVLRNMLYAGSATLAGLAHVVLDEVHYLADRFRGAVWEEVIIHLPDSVQLTALSATVSNAEEFGEWLQTVRGDTEIIVEERRPVPLWQHMLAGNRLYDLFVSDERQQSVSDERQQSVSDERQQSVSDERQQNASDGGQQSLSDDNGRNASAERKESVSEREQSVSREKGQGGEDGARPRVNPQLVRIAREDSRLARQQGRKPRQGGGRPRRFRVPSRVDVVERLDATGLLPAITFIFSRAGCDAAVTQCLRAGLRLVNQTERGQIRSHVEQRCAGIPDEDLDVLGYHEWLDGLERGVAAHHAGLLPTFKEVVEELFVRGLVKAVFATETLSLGINMPARTVVLERLVKFNGETHADITPGEYTQLTGRAGRRGIDVEGHAVVVWRPGVDPYSVAGLASTRTYPLRSSFRPSYNMAVNLVGQVGRDRARGMLEASFAQFQADRAVVGLARQVSRNEEALQGYREAMTCHLGDFTEYAKLRRELSEREKSLERRRKDERRADAARSLERLRRGDVIRVPAGRRAGLAVVLDPGVAARDDGPSPTVLTAGRQVKRLSMVDFPVPVEAVERVRVPNSFSSRSPQHRRDLASRLRDKVGDRDAGSPPRAREGGHGEDAEVARLRRELRRHPCHGCAEREDHARWAERYVKLERDTDGLRRRVQNRSHVIARTFDHVCTVLEQLDYLRGETVTEEGRRLGRIYSELDLLTAECLRSGVWEGLHPAELAACVSALVYETRSPDDSHPARTPRGRASEALLAMQRLWSELEQIEKDNRLSFLRQPDSGFAWTAYRWASGHSLDTVLSEADLLAGDFVRWMKQLIDLLGQIADAAPEDSEVRATAWAAVDAVRRGVVAYSSLN